VQSAELAALLTKPTGSYKNSARLAVAGLVLFVSLYFALAGWFLFTAWRVFFRSAGASLGIWAYIVAICAAFIGAFMLKAIFSVRNAKPDGLHEVTPEDQPTLFAFLFQLADAAGAPRPHKVFVSARVNAAVFYDLSLFNLIFPSKKNLEIGLALVNALSLGEFRAVLAHEFGHFAQRSMAVGRWVYVAQQIANHLVTRRDKLDDLLVTLGNIDLRIRAVVMLVQLVVWSIRSLVESAFNVVILMQRALSREMEMQADLVAVSLTGSDALVHALHKIQGADDAWDRALSFMYGQQGSGKATRDVFAVQSHMVQRMGAILNDDSYAQAPPLPAQGRDAHRIFKAGMAQPPRMWLTHPLNHEREANAKRIYVPAPIDPANAWSVFDKPATLREEMTARLLGESEAKAVELEESLKELGSQFKREQYHRRYCGIYFGRSLTRHAASLAALRDAAHAASKDGMAALYPASLTQDMQLLRSLNDELGQLQALIAGVAQSAGGTVRLRGVDYKKKELPAALERVKAEAEEVTARLRAHDHLCRSWHQGAASAVGGGWQAYLDGLLAVVHYAEHTSANLDDAHGLLQNTLSVETALRTVKAEGVSRIVMQANELHYVMEQIYAKAGTVTLDATLAAKLEADGNWAGMLGEFTLPLAGSENINDWLGALRGWLGHIDGCLSSLRTAALEQLLLTETMVARVSRQQAAPEAAPAPSQVPAEYPLLVTGGERARQTQLGWWARFQRADGLLPGAARLLAAGAIVGVVLGAGSLGEGGRSFIGNKPHIMAVNGLGVPVAISIDGASANVAAHATRAFEVDVLGKHHIEARIQDGDVIEAFDAEASPGQHPVYNVAGATVLVQWTAVYGKAAPVADKFLGAPRWLNDPAMHVFTAPPRQLKERAGHYQTVLDHGAALEPGRQLGLVPDENERTRLALLHARWDQTSNPHTLGWLQYAATRPGIAEVVAQRLQAAPGDIVLKRVEYDSSDPVRQAALCSRADMMAADKPNDSDLAYLAIRCVKGAAGEQKMRQAHARWPDNPWLANAVAYTSLHSKNWPKALPDLEIVRRTMPALAEQSSLMIARLRRFENPQADLSSLLPGSTQLQTLVELEKGAGPADSPGRAYAALASGSLASALASAMGDQFKEAHVLRLVAASDGASPDSARRALALPLDKGIDATTAWTSAALALKTGADARPYLEAAKRHSGPYHAAIAAFLADVNAHKDLNAAEHKLDTVPPDQRACAYSAGLVLAGQKAPPAWRQAVRRLLFASERPYFS
jgi:Zn-dependent protease with chaperone function